MAKLMRLIKSYDDFRREASEERAGARPKASPERPPLPAPREVAPPMPTAPSRAPATPPPPLAPATSPSEPSAPPPVTPPAPATTPASSSVASMASAPGLYDDALLAVARMFEAAAMENITPGRLRSAVDALWQQCPHIVEAVGSGRGLLRKAMGTYANGEGFLLPHSVNVAVLAVELAADADLVVGDPAELCLAGLVHDIGSVRLPQGLLTKSESLTPGEWEEMRARPRYTYELISGLGEPFGRAAEIAHQVYERLDGSGYPRGLQGDEILPEASILGTVDFFESFAHPRPYKSTLPGTANHGIQMLMQMADKFGSATLKALVGSIGLFPIGSYVRLSSGEIGRVVDVKKENPMRPEVEILLDGGRRPPDLARTLDLLSIPHIYVSRALTAADLRELGLLPPPSRIPGLAPPNNDKT